MLSSARPSSDALSSVGRLKPTFSESRRAGRTRPGAFGTVFGEARSSGASALRLGALWAMCCKVGLGESTFNVGSCRPEPQADRSESLRSTGRGGRRVGVRHLRLTRPTVARLPFHFGDGALLSSCCRFFPKHSKATLRHSKAFYILTGVEQSLGPGCFRGPSHACWALLLKVYVLQQAVFASASHHADDADIDADPPWSHEARLAWINCDDEAESKLAKNAIMMMTMIITHGDDGGVDDGDNDA